MKIKSMLNGIKKKFGKKKKERSDLNPRKVQKTEENEEEKENEREENEIKSAPYLSYWMSKLQDHMKLRNLIIPGSHAANSMSLKKPKLSVPFAQCQKSSLVDQLKMGVRFFDMRYGQVPEKKMKKLGLNQ